MKLEDMIHIHTENTIVGIKRKDHFDIAYTIAYLKGYLKAVEQLKPHLSEPILVSQLYEDIHSDKWEVVKAVNP